MLSRTSLSIFLCLLLLSGCASIRDRNVVLRGLDPEPISDHDWARIEGVYTGPLRANVDTFWGTKGVSASDSRLEVYGAPEAPLVFFKWNTAYSSALVSIDTRTESYTNIPQRQYGVKGRLRPSSHAPNELLVKLHPNVLSPTSFTYLIIRFRGDGCADVDYLGHFGWRGIGRLHRKPEFPGVCR